MCLINHFTPTTANGFSIKTPLFFFDKYVFSYYHIMSFLPVSLHNELIAQQLH